MKQISAANSLPDQVLEENLLEVFHNWGSILGLFSGSLWTIYLYGHFYFTQNTEQNMQILEMIPNI